MTAAPKHATGAADPVRPWMLFMALLVKLRVPDENASLRVEKEILEQAMAYLWKGKGPLSMTTGVDLFDRGEVIDNQIRRHSTLGCASPTLF